MRLANVVLRGKAGGRAPRPAGREDCAPNAQPDERLSKKKGRYDADGLPLGAPMARQESRWGLVRPRSAATSRRNDSVAWIARGAS